MHKLPKFEAANTESQIGRLLPGTPAEAPYQKLFGANHLLPETIFGVADRETHPFKLERLYDDSPVTEDRPPAPFTGAAQPVKVEPSPFRKRIEADRQKSGTDAIELPEIPVQETAYADTVPSLPYLNTVTVPMDLVDLVRKQTDAQTKELTVLYMERILPTMLGLDAAQTIVQATMRDALGVELDMNSTVADSLVPLTELELSSFYIQRMAIPQEVKDTLTKELVTETAKRCVDIARRADAKLIPERKFNELQAMVNRAVSSTYRAEDRKRRQAGAQHSAPVDPQTAVRQQPVRKQRSFP